MDAVSALLRAAIRIADASAALVVFDDEHSPLAFAGCSQAAAAAALRDGDGVHIDCGVTARPATLVLLGAQADVAGVAAVRALARELGDAAGDAAARFDADLATLARSVETLPDPIVIATPPLPGEEVARFAYVNGAFERLFGYATRDLAGRTEDVLFAPSTDMDDVAYLRERLADGEPVRRVLELQTREEVPRWVEFSSRVVADERGEPRYYVSALRDVSARKEFEAAVAAERQRLAVVLRASGDGVITVLPDGRIELINGAAQHLLNVAFAEAYGMPLRAVVDLRDPRDAPCEIVLDPNGEVRGEGLLYGPERNRNVAFVSAPIAGRDGTPSGFVVVLRDVTAHRRETRRQAYEAHHDTVTRLPNRRRLEELVAGAIESARHDGSAHAVGHLTLAAAPDDAALRDVAGRLSLVMRGNDVLARIGAGEFAVLLHECTPAGAVRVGDKLRAALAASPAADADLGFAPIDGASESVDAVLALAREASRPRAR
jgi:PAS domain S-box-containing protein/diguanylate cyclase (GGDEF)-like protein